MTPSSSSSSRPKMLRQWLTQLPPELALDISTLTPASSDASFRHYDRIQAADRHLIVMDAPPSLEDCRPFIDVTHRLHAAGLNVPQILASDVDLGFLLLSDLGRDTYYDAIQKGIAQDQLQIRYRAALDALVTLQTASISGLPVYDEPRLLQELQVFIDWYIKIHCQTSLDAAQTESLNATFMILAQHVAQEHKVLVHRDFHSPNLILSQDDIAGAPGIIDYQDAVYGAISYDLASLVFDARTTWEEPQQLDWAIRYWEKARAHGLPIPADFAQFHIHYEWTGLQRNLRILGVFSRLHYRDGKSHYLAHIPRVMRYVRQVAARYRAFTPLLRLLDHLEGTEPKTMLTF